MNGSKEKVLHCEEAKMLLTGGYTAVLKTERIIRTLTQCIRANKPGLEAELQCLSEGGSGAEYVYTDASVILGNVFGTLRAAAVSLYGILLEEPCSPPADGSINAVGITSVFDEKREELPPDFRVAVRLEPDGIYIRTPMLWTVNGRRTGSRKGGLPADGRGILFRNDVSDGIRSSPVFDVYDFGKYAEKLIHFCFVYAKEGGKILPADNDNHETKYIQDAIAMYLPGGDSPFTCGIFCSALQSEIIPEGTYITVTAAADGLKEEKEIERFWACLYSAE